MFPRISLILLTLISIASCENNNPSGINSKNNGSILKTMEENKIWPYKIKGILDMVDCGYGNGDFPNWCTGIIETENIDDIDEIIINTCGQEILKENNIYVDSGKNVSVSIDKTDQNYGINECKFSKVEIGKNVYKIISIEKNIQ